ncbi:putative E3 ubiquitin-protein ligase ZFP1 isoform B [Glycine soja]|uniref:RING-type E3 ubiquitin transferase n=1 Tax=Glycine soja TaxID=3848 RepID=A0A445HQV2_GLYSO|nr:putative E3 ubiquitin-protein ligase ZFP1 isoform B [Glycine soja]
MDQMSQQRHGYFHSESIHFRGSNISQPNVCTLVTASGNGTNLDSHYLLDAYDNGMVYGMTQYNGVQHQHNLDMGVPAAANLYYSSMNPSSGAAVSLNAEVMRGNYQYFNASASSSVAPPNARHTENGIPSLPHCTSWSRSGESMMVRDPNRITRVNYLSQHFQPAAPPPWLDQQLNSNNNDGHALPWHQSLLMPYVQAPSANGSSLENARMGPQRYHDTAGSRSGHRFPHPPLVNPHYHSFHHQTQPVQEMRGHSINFHPPPPVTAPSYRVPTNPSRSSSIFIQDSIEMGARHVGAAPFAGSHIYRPHRGSTHETTLRHRNLPPVTFLQVDGFIPLLFSAITLQFSYSYFGAHQFVSVMMDWIMGHTYGCFIITIQFHGIYAKHFQFIHQPLTGSLSKSSEFCFCTAASYNRLLFLASPSDKSVLTSLLQSIHVSFDKSKVYFLWEMKNPLFLWATSIPEKYLSFCNQTCLVPFYITIRLVLDGENHLHPADLFPSVQLMSYSLYLLKVFCPFAEKQGGTVFQAARNAIAATLLVVHLASQIGYGRAVRFQPSFAKQSQDVTLLVDHHNDMRLDIEDMSYEASIHGFGVELLALGERIGKVNTGLSEEMITSQMKTKTYLLLPTNAINLEEAASEEQENDSCIICQDEYKSQEKIGILQCGHEYHADCLKKWLLVKNVCPICKSEALTPGEKCV